MSWTPHSPGAIGFEWEPIHEDTTILNSATKPLAARLRASTTQTVDTAWFFSSAATGGVSEAYQIDVYEDGDFPGSTLTTYTKYPSATAATIGDVATWDGTTVGSTNQHTFVDNDSFTDIALPTGFIGRGDENFIYGPGGAAYLITFTFDDLDSDTAGEHIVKVTTEARVQAFSSLGDPQAFSAKPYLIIQGQPYWGSQQTYAGPAFGGHALTYDWFVNPRELRSWLPGDFTGFESGTNTDAAGWFVAATGSETIINAIYRVTMTVTTAGTDQRRAFGWVTPAQQRAGALAGIPAWVPVDLQEPDGTPGWIKSAGVDYRVELARRSVSAGGRTLYVIGLQGYDGGPVNGWERATVKYRPETRLPYLSEVDSSERSWAPAMVLEAGGTSSVDSQPYAALDLDSAVYSEVDFRQYFTTPASLPVTTFPLLRVLLGRVGTSASGPVTLRVRRVSDNVQLGSTVTITSDDFDAYTDDDGVQTYYARYKSIISKLTTAATLAPSTQYYFQVTSTATEPETGWRVETFRSIRGSEPDSPPPDIEDVTFGGDTNRVTVNGVNHPETDAALLLLTLPAAPTNLVAVQAVSGECVQYVSLTWTATALGGSFGRYELQRRDDPAGAWTTIARLTDEGATSFQDWESQRGRTAFYRLRVVRDDTAISNWSPTASAVAEAPCCGYLFTSNLRPDLTVFYPDLDADQRETDLPQNTEDVQFYGRDYQVVFRESEDRGARFRRSLIVAVDRGINGAEESTEPGLRTFADLLAITRPQEGGELPYVCVVEETGDRWFASVLTPITSRRVADGLHVADVEVIETTATPAPVDE